MISLPRLQSGACRGESVCMPAGVAVRAYLGVRRLHKAVRVGAVPLAAIVPRAQQEKLLVEDS